MHKRIVTIVVSECEGIIEGRWFGEVQRACGCVLTAPCVEETQDVSSLGIISQVSFTLAPGTTHREHYIVDKEHLVKMFTVGREFVKWLHNQVA